MTYVALLRGINVGGNRTVPMAKLKATFEGLGFTEVKTLLNSGNVIFNTTADPKFLCERIEKAIEHDFEFEVPTLLRSLPEMDKMMRTLPKEWANDEKTKCDVLFLWPAVDSRDALNQVSIKPDIEELIYAPGALIWRVGRENINRGSILKIVGTDFYKQVTIRSPNTIHKIYALMQAAGS